SASVAMTFTINNPQPEGGSASAGSNALTLDVVGVGFTHDSVVFVNGNPRVTTFVSSTMLQATLLASDLSQSGALTITVMNPPPGGGTSSPISFGNPVPQVSLLSPSSAVAGNFTLSLDVTGVNFMATSIVLVNGAVLPTTYVSSTVLHAAFPASALAQARTLNVSVMNPAPGGGTSSPLSFTVSNPQPIASSVSPASLPAGSSALMFTVTGTGFVSGSAGSVVLVGGSSRVTSFGSSTSLQAVLLPGDLSKAGTLDISVVNPPPGGGASSALSFTVTIPVTNPVTNPVPQVSLLSPLSAPPGSVALTLQVTGSNFNTFSSVLVNGSPIPTIYSSPTQLQATIPASALAQAGTLN